MPSESGNDFVMPMGRCFFTENTRAKSYGILTDEGLFELAAGPAGYGATRMGYIAPNSVSASSYEQQQLAANAGALTFTPGQHLLTEPILLGSKTFVHLMPGAELLNSGARRHNIFRTGNADYLSSQFAIDGVYILCADQAAIYGQGTLQYNHPAQTLVWTAPGDVAGAAVSISSVVSAATSGIFTIPSATPGKNLYVIVVVNAGRSSTKSRQVRVEPITGAVQVSWTRASNITVVTEANHTRQIGDLIQCFGTNLFGHFVVTAVTTTTYSFADTRGASSGTGAVFSVSDITLLGSGARVDYAGPVLTGNVDGHCNMVFFFMLLNRGFIQSPTFTRNSKYAVYLSGCTKIRGFNLNSIGEASTGNDLLHISGPNRNIRFDGITGTPGDNLVGIGSADFLDYNVFWPTAGTLDVDNVRLSALHGDSAKFELARIYCGNAGWIRNIKIDGVSGTVDSNTPAIVSIITDGSGSNPDTGATNIDGFELSNVTGTRQDGNHCPQVSFTGTGTRKNIRINGVLIVPSGINFPGSIVIDAPLEDITVRNLRCRTKYGGYAITVRGVAVKDLTVEDVILTADSQVQGWINTGGTLGPLNLRPVLVYFESGSGSVTRLTIRNVTIIEDSPSGNRSCIVFRRGTCPNLTLDNIRIKTGATNPDSLIRQASTTVAGSIYNLNNIDCDGDFLIAIDAGSAGTINMNNVRQTRGTTYQNGSSAVEGVTFNLSNVTSVGTFLNVPVTGPLFRMGNLNNMQINGLLLDATVANHAPGSGFYNNNAGFGAGIGQYSRGAAAWVRIAA